MLLRVFAVLAAFSLVAAAHMHGSSPSDVHHRRFAHPVRRSRNTCRSNAAGNGTTTNSGPSASAIDNNLAPQESSSHDASPTSHTSSPTAASPSPTVGSIGSTGSDFSALAPISYLEMWSTSPSAPDPLPLSDDTFHPKNVLKALPHPYVNAPDGQLSIKATYPEGSYNFQHQPLGGLSFYAPGPASVDLTTAREITLGYTVYFESGFDFNIGGKLPGIYGGDSDEIAVGCSGGRRDDGCMSVRLMWRAKGDGEVYTYLPPGYSANDNVCNIPPFSTCNPTYGASVARGSYTWEAGKATAVSMRVRLNDAGQENGEIEFWANGASVMSAGGLVLRDSDAGRFRGIQMQTFFGGSTDNFASPKTQSSYLRDFTLAITEKL